MNTRMKASALRLWGAPQSPKNAANSEGRFGTFQPQVASRRAAAEDSRAPTQTARGCPQPQRVGTAGEVLNSPGRIEPPYLLLRALIREFQIIRQIMVRTNSAPSFFNGRP